MLKKTSYTKNYFWYNYFFILWNSLVPTIQWRVGNSQFQKMKSFSIQVWPIVKQATKQKRIWRTKDFCRFGPRKLEKTYYIIASSKCSDSLFFYRTRLLTWWSNSQKEQAHLVIVPIFFVIVKFLLVLCFKNEHQRKWVLQNIFTSISR